MYRKLALPFTLTILLLAAPVAAQSTLGDCMIGPALGSSLLVPYFEVDRSNPSGLTTILTINNGRDDPTLVRVVLWTDWGVPTLAFEVYLSGFDVQPIDLRAIFNGSVPSTGEGADLSGYLFCDLVPPFHGNPILTANQRAQLAADHTGREGPVFLDCAGESYGDEIARGYITVGTVAVRRTQRSRHRSVGIYRKECTHISDFSQLFGSPTLVWLEGYSDPQTARSTANCLRGAGAPRTAMTKERENEKAAASVFRDHFSLVCGVWFSFVCPAWRRRDHSRPRAPTARTDRELS